MTDNNNEFQPTNSCLSESGKFNIYLRISENDGTQHEFEAVKNGFSWTAFFFGAFWAYWNGMTGRGFSLLLIFVILNTIGKVVKVNVSTMQENLAINIILVILSISICTWIGSSGNKWIKSSLEKKDYKLIETNYSGDSKEEAMQTYIAKHYEGIIDDNVTPKFDETLNAEESIRSLHSKGYRIEEKTNKWIDSETKWLVTEPSGRKRKVTHRGLQEYVNKTE